MAKWPNQLDALLDSRAVRPATKRAGVHLDFVFRWRHRFLERVKDDQPDRLAGIVEADKMFLIES